ncbi:MAG: hypothetical protein WD154_01760 [Nitrosopumilaceae archaeon]
MPKNKTVVISAIGIAILIIGLFALVEQTSGNGNCTSIEDINKITEFDLKLLIYLPSDYIFVACQGNPFEAQIMYQNKDVISNNESLFGNVHEHVANGAIYLYVLNEKNFLGEEQFQKAVGNSTSHILETIKEANEKNPSLNMIQVNIQGNVGWANDICDACGKQIANFPNNTIVQYTSTPARIKFYDENDVLYFFQSNIPLDELIKVTESLR